MRKVTCTTNLDLFNEEWPTLLATIPKVGDYIESATLRTSGFQLNLKVVTVRHRCTKINGIKTWYTEVELHLGRTESIREFYEWYAPLIGKSVSYFI